MFFSYNLYSYNPSHCTTLLNSLLVYPLLIAIVPTSWSQLWGHLKEGEMVTLWWGFTLCWVSSVSQQWQYNQVSWRQGHKCPAEVQDQRRMLEMLRFSAGSKGSVKDSRINYTWNRVYKVRQYFKKGIQAVKILTVKKCRILMNGMNHLKGSDSQRPNSEEQNAGQHRWNIHSRFSTFRAILQIAVCPIAI